MSIDVLLDFAHAHRDDDPVRLLLQQTRYPGIDLSLVAQQLEGQRQASVKWPTLADCPRYFYPPRLNREQSSSEAAAQYKASLARQWEVGTVADLTGGMGIDSLFLARVTDSLDYCERDGMLCDIARHNFAALGQGNIQCHACDSMAWLEQQPMRYDLIYIDPARRDSQGRKVAAFEDCTPDLPGHLALLRSRCRRLLVKASPMIDLHAAVGQLGSVAEVHIVAVRGECKEVLFVLDSQTMDVPGSGDPVIHCVNLPDDEAVTFTWAEEAAAQPRFAAAMGTYLYEPHAALMKGGCYQLLSKQYDVAQLSRNTHLYTSDQWIAGFPGRRFRVLQELTPTPKAAAAAIPGRKAHVVTRNYPLAAADLQRRLRLTEGGSLFVIAATLGSTPKVWLCEK